MTPAQAPLPFLGTWKLTKCETSRPDLPHPASGTTTFTEEQGSIRYSAESEWSDGTKAKVHAILKLDGSWCPVSGSPLADSISIESTPNGLVAKLRKAGKNVGTTHSTVSSDGRTTNGVWEIVGPGGTAVTWKTTSTRA